MILLTISTLLFAQSTTILFVASKPNVPWNYDERDEPPSFPSEPPSELKSILPPETFAQLRAIHQDQSLTVPEKMMKIDEIINGLPENILQQLPLPPVFRLLPQYVQEVMKAIRIAKNITVEEKWLQMAIIIDSLPSEQQKMLQQIMPHFTLASSSEFKDILPKDVWNQLVATYQDAKLSDEQKVKRIDEVINELPDSISQRLPLLSPFQKLPANVQEKLQAVHVQHKLSEQQRFQKIKAMVESLPLEMKKLAFMH
ncbi:unnamed protein product [Litomosoides sigmodontis]|uniref:SXP/RAL-2 family protein Ani s 5-like cation-binding domain-containing protein n=1 Tax=Litomosoides sigmodontis TaxID=42156 RepID=A0A3P6UZ27_LITSI|nr:unnamed protein product [Litomosoides sigmodontis]